jgi:hypothetical protein
VFPSYGAIIDTRRLFVKLRHNEAMQRHLTPHVLVRLVQVRDMLYPADVDTLDTRGQTAIEPGKPYVVFNVKC